MKIGEIIENRENIVKEGANKRDGICNILITPFMYLHSPGKAEIQRYKMNMNVKDPPFVNENSIFEPFIYL